MAPIKELVIKLIIVGDCRHSVAFLPVWSKLFISKINLEGEEVPVDKRVERFDNFSAAYGRPDRCLSITKTMGKKTESYPGNSSSDFNEEEFRSWLGFPFRDSESLAKHDSTEKENSSLGDV